MKALRVAFPIHMIPWGDAPGHGIGRYMYEVARRLVEGGAELGVELRIYQDPHTHAGPFAGLPLQRFPGLRDTLGLPAREQSVATRPLPPPGEEPPSPLGRAHNRLRDASRARFLGRQPLDLLHFAFHVGRAPAPRGLPTLITVYDLVPQLYPETVAAATLYGWRQFLRCAKRAAHFLTISEAAARDIEQHLGIGRERVTVAAPGVDPCYTPPRDRTAAQELLRERYGVRPPYLLLVSTIEPRKNQAAAVRALTRLPAEIGLVLAGGKGWKSERLPGLIEELGMKERVHFPGFVADQDLPLLYGCAEALVFPSHYEGFGMPILEAFACGTPVVCSRSGALPEVAAGAAALVEADDWQALAVAIQELLASRRQRTEMRERGFARARHYTWERTVVGTVEAYRKVVAD